ncbi:MAG: CHRD domain-containing protein [Candidatus Bipolaricaulota bacterium]|nr:CHRD domain-containing protein [Candidatus Bipolaricaulota bacterium]MBS3791969.1 CHRD domain-containing protein [Candidatus Bipolaricaulota bacterium]
MFNNFPQKLRNSCLVYFSFALVLPLLVISLPAESHPPSSMELDYAGEVNTLTVRITHRVGNPSNHYVEKLTVFKNGNQVLEENYDEQEAGDGGSYVFELAARNGDSIEVRGVCNQFGSISQSIEVEGVPVGEPVLLRARLIAETEVQGVKEKTPASASGFAIALLDRDNNLLEFSIAYKGLSDRPTMAHFHRGNAGEEGPPVRTVFGKPEIESAPTSAPEGNSGFVSGTWKNSDDQPLTDELVDALLSGEIYLNIHTELNPAGEIRAQLEEVE